MRDWLSTIQMKYARVKSAETKVAAKVVAPPVMIAISASSSPSLTKIMCHGVPSCTAKRADICGGWSTVTYPSVLLSLFHPTTEVSAS